MNPNTKIQAPFGDIFYPNTSATDRLSQRLYIEQKQREARNEQMNAALDNEFSKNLSGIRDVDVPDLTRLYNDWKTANINSMKQRDGVNPEQQMDLLRKKAAVYSLLSRSKSVKEYEDNVAKNGFSKPDLMEDDWQQRLYQSRHTPVSDNNGIHDYDYSYKGDNYTDAATDMQKAYGTKKVIQNQSKAYPDATDKYRINIPQYEVSGATPTDVMNYYLNRMADRKAQKHYLYELRNLPQDELVKTQNEFNSIPDDHWELLGIKKPELAFKNDDDISHVIATYKAMKYAIGNMPKEISPLSRVNESLVTSDRNKEWNRRNSLTFRQSMEKIAANKVAGKPVEDTGYISDNVADEVGETVEMNDGTTKRVIDVTNIDPERLKIINGAGDPKKLEFGVAPIQMYDSKLKKNRLVYYQDQETGDWIGKDGQKISREAAKDRYVNKYSPTAFKSKTNTQAQEKKAGVANQSSGNAKTISTSRLKGLVGTKGYEGYSLQEIIDYYKSNGYKVD
jgi:hypothetical protein